MLRHKGVFGDLGAVDRSKEADAILRKFQEPTVVEFRRGGDIGPVVNAVKNSRYVEVRAAVGAGKSTVVPLALSKAMGCLVIHTIPFHIAAHYLADHLMSQEVDGDKFVYMDDVTSDMPAHGVVLMSTPFFHAKRAYDGFAGVDNAVLYLDESHESDAWTAALRTMAPAMKIFHVVKATATAGPNARMNPDLPAKTEVFTYPAVDGSTWSASDQGFPWSASQIQNSTVICNDRVQVRRTLAAQYVDYGFIVRDCSDQDYPYFSETMRMVKDPREGIVIALVDYKFRSSLTLVEFRDFIDSCEVAVPIVRDSMPKVVFRDAYDPEVQQFFGRAGRVPGPPVRLWRSKKPSPKMMCDLESLECDAANLLYRMMGFRPPLDLIKFPYFGGEVPMDIAAAMASEHPLRLCPPESLVPWINGHKAFIEEKKKSAYAYDVAMRRRAIAVSCHTLMEKDRVPSPPPAVPDRFRETRVDVDGLDEYKTSRDSSPSAVFTLDTDVYDNLSAARDASAERPKRIAKRFLMAKAAEDAAKQQVHELVEEEKESKQTELSLIDKTSDVQSFLRDQLKTVGLPTVEHMPVSVAAQSQAASAAEVVMPVYQALREHERHGPDIIMGEYYHYHDMHKAPDVSVTFVRGVESVVKLCEGYNARQWIKGLTDAEKLHAMKLLVDASNNSTAITVGIQRVFMELSGRPPEQWQTIVDRSAMTEEIEWMIANCTEEQAKLRVYHSIIPLFAKYDLDKIPRPLELEQFVMRSVMERFERIAVKKNLGSSNDYWQQLNGRGIIMAPRDVRARGRSYLISSGDK